MGVAVSKPTNGDDLEAVRRSKQIDKQILHDQRESGKVVKLLLLGAAESGKSTILKQMKILHRNGFEKHERDHERLIIYDNVIQATSAILKAMKDMDIHFERLEREFDSKLIVETVGSRQTFHNLPMDLTAAMQRLILDKGFQACLSRRNEIDLSDSATYFIENFGRLSAYNYEPTEQDMLRSRRATTGITEVVFEMNDLEFKVIDVGGQRSERRKWIHCFDNVNAVFFLLALSEYNLMLAEDQQQNRMVESLTLFKYVCNTRWFTETSMILFLNKRDLFTEKLKIFPLTLAFPEYEGTQSYSVCVDYIQKKFEGVKKNPQKQIYCHQTCATDTSNVQKVFDSCIVIIISNNLSQAGLSS